MRKRNETSPAREKITGAFSFWDFFEIETLVYAWAITLGGILYSWIPCCKQRQHASLCNTSHESRMLPSVTINCQVTMIVINLGSQLSELQSVSQMSQVSRTVFSIVSIVSGQLKNSKWWGTWLGYILNFWPHNIVQIQRDTPWQIDTQRGSNKMQYSELSLTFKLWLIQFGSLPS